MRLMLKTIWFGNIPEYYIQNGWHENQPFLKEILNKHLLLITYFYLWVCMWMKWDENDMMMIFVKEYVLCSNIWPLYKLSLKLKHIILLCKQRTTPLQTTCALKIEDKWNDYIFTISVVRLKKYCFDIVFE